MGTRKAFEMLRKLHTRLLPTPDETNGKCKSIFFSTTPKKIRSGEHKGDQSDTYKWNEDYLKWFTQCGIDYGLIALEELRNIEGLRQKIELSNNSHERRRQAIEEATRHRQKRRKTERRQTLQEGYTRRKAIEKAEREETDRQRQRATIYNQQRREAASSIQPTTKCFTQPTINKWVSPPKPNNLKRDRSASESSQRNKTSTSSAKRSRTSTDTSTVAICTKCNNDIPTSSSSSYNPTMCLNCNNTETTKRHRDDSEGTGAKRQRR